MKQKNASFIFKLLLHRALSPLNYSVVITQWLGWGQLTLCDILSSTTGRLLFGTLMKLLNSMLASSEDNPSGFRSCVLGRDKQKLLNYAKKLGTIIIIKCGVITEQLLGRNLS